VLRGEKCRAMPPIFEDSLLGASKTGKIIPVRPSTAAAGDPCQNQGRALLCVGGAIEPVSFF
jgi:hypothetical protein